MSVCLFTRLVLIPIVFWPTVCCLPGSMGPQPRLLQLELLIVLYYIIQCLVRERHFLNYLWHAPFCRRSIRKYRWRESLDSCYPRTVVTIGTQESHTCSTETQERWPCMSICKFRLKSNLLSIKVAECIRLQYLCGMHLYFFVLFILLSIYPHKLHPHHPQDK